MTTTQPTVFLNGIRSLKITERCVIVTDEKGWSHTYHFDSPEQAHRASLAILTGPGKVKRLEVFDGDIPAPNAAVNALSEHFAALDARAAAEAEAAELQAEAEQLYATYCTTRGWDHDWSEIRDDTRDAWVAIAREARRLHTNKENQHG